VGEWQGPVADLEGLMNAQNLALAGAKLLLGEQNYYAAGLRLQLVRAKLQGKTPLYVHVVGKAGSRPLCAPEGTAAGRNVAVFQSHHHTGGDAFQRGCMRMVLGGWDQTPPEQRYIIRSRTPGDHLGRARTRTRLRANAGQDPVATKFSGCFTMPGGPRMAAKVQDGRQIVWNVCCNFSERYPHEALDLASTELRPMFGGTYSPPNSPFSTRFIRNLRSALLFSEN
jgi:hypothetical protein